MRSMRVLGEVFRARVSGQAAQLVGSKKLKRRDVFQEGNDGFGDG
jgi:hypothetical protein